MATVSLTDPRVITNRARFEAEHQISVTDWSEVMRAGDDTVGLPVPGKATIGFICRCGNSATVEWPKRGAGYIPRFICLNCVHAEEEMRLGVKITNWGEVPQRIRGIDIGKIVPSRIESPVTFKYLCPGCGIENQGTHARLDRPQERLVCQGCIRKEFETEFGAAILNWDEIKLMTKGSDREKPHYYKTPIKFTCTGCQKMAQRNWYTPYTHPRTYTSPLCDACEAARQELLRPQSTSAAEQEIGDLIESWGFTIVRRDRTIIQPDELDIVIPSKKVAIEFNGVHFHTVEMGKGPDYHLNKTEMCAAVGIRLIHIFEDEWMEKRQIAESRLASILGYRQNLKRVHARKCEITETVKYSFWEDNHLQGRCVQSISYGLIYQGEVIAAMSFGPTRGAVGIGSTGNNWELLRFASKIGYQIPGAASRLLARFRKDHKMMLVSYADRRWSDGGLYRALGFQFTHNSAPGYFYRKNSWQRLRRERFQKHKLVARGADPSKTEFEIMAEMKYERIYDCGQLVFTLA